MRSPQWIVSVSLVAAVAGCGTQADRPPVRGPASNAATPAPAASTGALASTVEFSRTGGIAGVDDRLVVQPDGAYTIVNRGGTKRGRLTEAELRGLRAALDGFAAIPASNPPDDGVADGFQYRVGYAGREVRAGDGGMPAGLDPIVGALNAILATYG